MSGRRRDDPGRVASNPGRRTRNGSANQHPGMANYPADDSAYRRARRPPPMPSANRYLPPLGQQQEPDRSSSSATAWSRPRRTDHRHPRRGAAKPRNGFADVLDGPAGRHRRRRRQVRSDRADVAGGGELRGRRRDGRGAGQHVVFCRGDRREQGPGCAVPADYHRAVRGDRATHRSGAGPAAARPPRRPGCVVRASHDVGTGADHELRRCHRELPVDGALSLRAGHDGVLEVVQRAAQRGDTRG